MIKMYVAAFFFALIAASTAQYVSPGQCEDKNVLGQSNFDWIGYTGLFYGVRSTIRVGSCVTVDYPLINATAMGIILNQTASDGSLSSRAGIVDWVGASNRTGLVVVTYPNESQLRYQLVNTDYINYGINYRCDNVNSTSRSETVWVLGRQKTLSSTVNAIVDSAIADLGFSGDEFNLVDHSNCA